MQTAWELLKIVQSIILKYLILIKVINIKVNFGHRVLNFMQSRIKIEIFEVLIDTGILNNAEFSFT